MQSFDLPKRPNGIKSSERGYGARPHGDSLISRATSEAIIEHFHSLEFWQSRWRNSAVAVIGSITRGVDDEFSDIDVRVLVPSKFWGPIYEHYRHAIEAGRIHVLNPAALKYDEFPVTYIDGLEDVEYKLETFEYLERKVAHEYDDVLRWIHGSCTLLHDPTQRYADIRRQCASYPEDVWLEKLTEHYLAAWHGVGGAKNSLRRNEREAVVLSMSGAVSHLLKLCCLMDGKPPPYDKWLYREAMQTIAGKFLRPEFEKFFSELGHPELRRVVPDSYEKPDDRDADLEEFPIFDIWRRAKTCFDGVLPFKR